MDKESIFFKDEKNYAEWNDLEKAYVVILDGKPFCVTRDAEEALNMVLSAENLIDLP